MSYTIILTDDGTDSIVGHYATLEDAKKFLNEYLYWVDYRRQPQGLDISPDGMSGTGVDGNNQFTYTIKQTA